MTELLDLILHLQDHLHEFTREYGALVYALLFLIVFCETGLVVTPILPGDSLIFGVGMVAANASSGLNVWIAGIVLLVAAILGDTVNYWIGRKAGSWMMRKFPKIVRPEHIVKTSGYFERYGGKTIIIARFVPIVRTFAPFVAGMGSMEYRRFMFFNVIGAIIWIGLLLPGGYLLAEVKVTWFGREFSVKEHFGMVVMAIIAISLLPVVIEYIKSRRRSKMGSGEPVR